MDKNTVWFLYTNKIQIKISVHMLMQCKFYFKSIKQLLFPYVSHDLVIKIWHIAIQYHVDINI